MLNTATAIILCLDGFISHSGLASAATQYGHPGLTVSGTGSSGAGTWLAATANRTDEAVDAVLTSTDIAGPSGKACTVRLTTLANAEGFRLDAKDCNPGDRTNIILPAFGISQ